MAAAEGWRNVSVARAARDAGLDLGQARSRFPFRGMILARLGLMADEAALAGAPADGPSRERLFDMVMRRFDLLQQHRDGVLAVLAAMPGNPLLAMFLADATRRSMAWMLEGAGIEATGLRGGLRVQGMLAIWTYVTRAWRDDQSADLGGTMAALDKALERAEQVEAWFSSGGKTSADEPTATDLTEPALDVSVPDEPFASPPVM